jgi:2-haloalkanoic acid dehalogenase type II
MSHPDLTTFRALSFDCYGTLIDWETGITSALDPLISQLPDDHPYRHNPLRAVHRFNEFTHDLWVSQPKMLYSDQLKSSYRSLAAELNLPTPPETDVENVGAGPGRWDPFPDTVEGLRKLGQHYKLILLSNVSNELVRHTVDERLAGARIDAAYTAEDIGSYKPDHGNFRYLFEHAKSEFGIDWERGDLLHVANSLPVDHVPAKELGLRSVWIARGGGNEGDLKSAGPLEELRSQGKLAFEWRFDSIGEFADEVERQFAAKGKQ